jgi:hypothetical protein
MNVAFVDDKKSGDEGASARMYAEPDAGGALADGLKRYMRSDSQEETKL